MLITVSIVGAIAIVASDLLVPPSPEEQLRGLRPELAALRAAADSCTTALAREEARLRASDARLDSLKRRIDAFETLDSRGVPADSYDAYLETFNAYNAGVPDRTVAAETLQAHWRACRAIAERHNGIADSARAIAVELGLVRDSARDVTR